MMSKSTGPNPEAVVGSQILELGKRQSGQCMHNMQVISQLLFSWKLRLSVVLTNPRSSVSPSEKDGMAANLGTKHPGCCSVRFVALHDSQLSSCENPAQG